MTTEQFTYWLQGFAELHPEPPSAEQWQAIRDHLALVFNKQTPNRISFPATADPVPYYPPNAAFPKPYLPATTIC